MFTENKNGLNMKKYSGLNTAEISFPLGGIGTGSIGLAGNGSLMDWEIKNRPDKGSRNGYSFFAVKAEKAGKLIDARCLQGDTEVSRMGLYSGPMYDSYGFGPSRVTLAGLPHFKEQSFSGAFPFAELDFAHETFPGRVKLEAYNPFIPHKADDSSIPCAVFRVSFENTDTEAIDYSVCLCAGNPAAKGGHNVVVKKDGVVSIVMRDEFEEGDPQHGELAVSAYDNGGVSLQNNWFGGSWFDGLTVFWHDFTDFETLPERVYPEGSPRIGDSTNCSLCVKLHAEPGETAEAEFVISWYYPVCENYWNPAKEGPNTWKNWYAKLFASADDAARYMLANEGRLYDETLRFAKALYSVTMPEAAIEAVGANLSTLKSPTVLRLENGEFYGWEGLHVHEGSCEGTCTHVWNYAYALCYLFPELERSIRETDFKYNQDDNGGMRFRMQLPLGRKYSSFRPCADGQFGGVLKTYREWKLCGDTEWLRMLWPEVKRSIEYAWSPNNPDKWDPEKSGLLTGRQHHTLDMELFGPNSWLSGFYVAALKAGAEMAEAMGDTEAAAEFTEIYERGRAKLNTELFNGKWYGQRLDIGDKSNLTPYLMENHPFDGAPVTDTYWDDEHKQIKYQLGEGCIIDQVLAQWHANLSGLGDIFDREQTKTALRSIFENNFHPVLRDYFNPCRVFSCDGEGALCICSWRGGAKKPIIPVPYSEESMTGFEYQAAIHMIQMGLEEEGMTCVKAIRDRFDGMRRNPWNEFECGSSYARAMASYALLPTYAGMTADMRCGSLGFAPIHAEAPFRTMWSVGGAYGTLDMDKAAGKAEFRVLGGSIELKELKLAGLGSGKAVCCCGKSFDMADGIVSGDIALGEGAVLTVTAE